MRFDILTIFPDLLHSPLQEGIIRRAIEAGKVAVAIHDIREFAADRHAMTDDRPFGGGEGMVMKPEPVVGALEYVRQQAGQGHVILLSPQGRLFSQAVAEELAARKHLVLICGRYEGVDERVRAHFVDDEVSIGDYVLTGGELPALILVDAITRLVDGVLGCARSASHDTFSAGLLKHPQFTRPREFMGHAVPEVLLSGDHAAIAEWRFIESLLQTARRRPELLAGKRFTAEELRIIKKKSAQLPEVIGLLPELAGEKAENRSKRSAGEKG